MSTSSHIGFQVRTQSRLFRELPCDTDVLTATDDLRSLQVPGLENFSKRLAAYEAHLFSFADNSLDVTDTHRLLGIELGLLPQKEGEKTLVIAKPSSNPCTSPVDYSKAQGARMVTLLSAYKLLDVICGKDPLFQDRRGSPKSRHGELDPKVQKLPLAHTLRNWTSVLKTFHSSYSLSRGSGELDQHVRTPRCGAELKGSAPLVNASALLVSQMAINKKNRVINTMESNIMLCALAISYLLKDTSSGVGVPDLPDDPETFANLLGNSLVMEGHIVQSDDTKALIQICNDSRPAGSKPTDKLWHIMVPLACALWLSPLSVFCSRSLTTLTFQRRALITSSLALGNDKPPLLRSCEGIVWGVILDIVFGRLHPSLTVSTLHAKLPWTEILQLDAMEHINSWFIEDSFQSAPVPPRNHIIPQNEMPLSPSISLSESQRPLILAPPSSPLTPQAPPVLVPSPSSSFTPLPPVVPPPLSPLLPQPSPVVPPPLSSPSSPSSPQPPSVIPSPLSSLSPLPLPHHLSVSPPSSPPRPPNPLNSTFNPQIVGDNNPDPPRKSGRLAELGKQVNHSTHGDTIMHPQVPPPRDPPAHKNKRKPISAPILFDSDTEDAEMEDAEDIVRVGSKEYPVDVDAFVASRDPVSLAPILLHKRKEQMLDLDQNTVRIPGESDQQLIAYDIDGGEHNILSSTHFDDYHARLRSIHARSTKLYKDHQPPHVSNPNSSVFIRMSYEEFSAKKPAELHHLLKHKCIVVTEWGKKRSGFDAENLQEIVSLFRPISIQDYSLRAGGNDAPTSVPEIVQGTMQQLLDNASLRDKGRVLNALDLPRPQALSVPPALASDFKAWEAMTDAYDLPKFMDYPNGDVSWYLVGLEGALTFFHLDSDGLCTGVNVEYGKKLWGIMTPRNPIGHHNISTLTSELFSADEIEEDGEDYDIELVVLRQQDGIIMGPNTLHCAGTLDNAICQGFHFYSSSLLLRSTAGLINTFILSDFLSNTHHNATRAILLRMLSFNFAAHFERRFGNNEYYQSHLVEIETWHGVASLMSLCNLAILVNVLDFRTYLGPNQAEADHPTERQLHDLDVYDMNHIVWPERMTMCHGRGMALAILTAISECCQITDTTTGSIIQDLPLRHLARQMVAISQFKGNAVSASLDGAPHCTHSSLKRQLLNVATWNSVLANLYKLPNLIDLDCTILSFTGYESYHVQWTADPHVWFLVGAPTDKNFAFMEEGYTSFDRKFFNRGADEERPRKRAKTSH